MRTRLDWLRQHIGRRDGGQGLAEYALIVVLIAIFSIVFLMAIGGQISSSLSTIGSTV